MKHLVYILMTITLALTLCEGCRGTEEHPGVVGGLGRDARIETVRRLCVDDSSAGWEPATAEMPEPCVNMAVRHLGNYAEVFNDSNYVHWTDAEKCGITPISQTLHYWINRSEMEKVVSCADYYVDNLNYSVPYLVPGAARMLHEIGRRFNDSLQARGGGDYRIKVTSVTRTPRSVARLRRVNKNSIDSSTHTLGTTIDISYARFVCDNPTTVARSTDQLKGLLAEVLYDMRSEGWCWVKFERKQPCFHISYRGLQDKKDVQ